ncbi:MAG: hypothetical protein K0R18_2485 [Bacillales bacterium]|jgi:hypothetical protein|nr:hypothetical protein [Bacillales bacterium]
MGILENIRNKKSARKNNWNNAPYYSPHSNQQNYTLNQLEFGFPQSSIDFQRYDLYQNENNLAASSRVQNGLSYESRRNEQPFYGNPLSQQPNHFENSYTGHPQSTYPFVGDQFNPNHYQSNPVQQGYYPNGAPQQGIQPNPFQVNPYFQQPYQPNGAINKQSSGFTGVLNQFKSQNGSVDFNKMLNTAGQMVSAVNQFSGIVKGIGGIFKS